MRLGIVYAPPPILMVDNLKKCPFCAEEIHADARKCKHCGEMLDGATTGSSKTRKIGIGSVLGWIFGPLFFLMALVTVLSSPIEAAILLVWGAIVFPPITKQLQLKYGLTLSRGLKVLIFLLGFLLTGYLNSGHTSTVTNSSPTNAATTNEEPKLEVQALTFTVDYGFNKVEGAVKNLTGEPMEGVTVVANFYDKKGTFVKSDSSLIDYNPILPGQESPFSTIGTSNPEIETVRVQFKYFFGGTIPHKDSIPR